MLSSRAVLNQIQLLVNKQLFLMPDARLFPARRKTVQTDPKEVHLAPLFELVTLHKYLFEKTVPCVDSIQMKKLIMNRSKTVRRNLEEHRGVNNKLKVRYKMIPKLLTPKGEQLSFNKRYKVICKLLTPKGEQLSSNKTNLKLMTLKGEQSLLTRLLFTKTILKTLTSKEEQSPTLKTLV